MNKITIDIDDETITEIQKSLIKQYILSLGITVNSIETLEFYNPENREG